MCFTKNWIADWHLIDGGERLSRLITPVFEAYLTALQDKGKSKSTLRRHTSSCHALGGYIVDRICNKELESYNVSETGEEILLSYLDGCDGPLIFQDNESWQREVDTTCRNLYKFIKEKSV